MRVAAGVNEDEAETFALEACAGWPISRGKSCASGSDLRLAAGRRTRMRRR